MKIQKIYKKASISNPTNKRYISENYIVLNILFKKITPLIAYMLKKIKISANFITILSIILTIVGSIFIFYDKVVITAFCWIFALFFDSLDGDLARISDSSSKFGNQLDTFGSDIFYFFFPISTATFLYKSESFTNIFGVNFIFIGCLISFFFLSYRYMNQLNLRTKLSSSKIKKIKRKKEQIIFKFILKIINNEFIRGNLFSEPGMILIFFIFCFIKNFYLFEIYLYILLIFVFIKVIISSTKLYILRN